MGVQVGCMLNVHRARNESQPVPDYSPFGEKVLISDDDVIGRNVVFRSVGT